MQEGIGEGSTVSAPVAPIVDTPSSNLPNVEDSATPVVVGGPHTSIDISTGHSVSDSGVARPTVQTDEKAHVETGDGIGAEESEITADVSLSDERGLSEEQQAQSTEEEGRESNLLTAQQKVLAILESGSVSKESLTDVIDIMLASQESEINPQQRGAFGIVKQALQEDRVDPTEVLGQFAGIFAGENLSPEDQAAFQEVMASLKSLEGADEEEKRTTVQKIRRTAEKSKGPLKIILLLAMLLSGIGLFKGVSGMNIGGGGQQR